MWAVLIKKHIPVRESTEKSSLCTDSKGIIQKKKANQISLNPRGKACRNYRGHEILWGFGWLTFSLANILSTILESQNGRG